MAVTDKSKRSKGISAFIFEKGMKGFSPSKKENKLGLRASETASVVFEDCFVPDEQLLGEEGQGFRERDGDTRWRAYLDRGAGRRHRPGRVRIGRAVFEGATAVWKTDLGVSGDPVQAGQYGDADRCRATADVSRGVDEGQGKKTTKESSMAKLFASEISVNVCEEAIQVHGGYGYTKDYPPEKYWRDSKLCTIGEGTSEIQRIIIAREVLKQI